MSRTAAVMPPPMPPFAALESPAEVAEAVDNVDDVFEVAVLLGPAVVDVLSGAHIPEQSRLPLIETRLNELQLKLVAPRTYKFPFTADKAGRSTL